MNEQFAEYMKHKGEVKQIPVSVNQLELIAQEVSKIGLSKVVEETLIEQGFIKDSVKPKMFKSYGYQFYVDYWRSKDGTYKFCEIAQTGG
jgi:hypothetical protein